MKTTWFDRLMISLAPRYGLERVRARNIAESISRHYEAAQPGRRTDAWNRTATDADFALKQAARDLRFLSRDLIRNNSWARRGQRIVANNMIGTGIVPKPVDVPDAVAKKALQLWKNWATTVECETEGRHTFYGIQHLAAKAVFSDGEFLIRRRPRLAKDDLTIPLQLQLLEADYLDTAKNDFDSQAGGPIIQGVEFDKVGRRAAYWLWSQHPGSGRNISVSARIPASEVIHVYYTERPGQSRGVSWLASAILNLKDLDDFDDAELMKQKIAACYAAFVEDPTGAGAPIGEQSDTDPHAETMEPGMIEYLEPGKKITFGTPPVLTSDSFQIRNLRRIAAGIPVTYEDLTGDYSQVNFSSARMSRIAHWAAVRDWQNNMMIPLMCNAVWDWAMQAAYLDGELPVVCCAEWTPPPMPMLEPDKEGLAYSRLIRNGAMTISEMVREQGGDPDAHFEEYAADLKKLDALGIILDSDARKTSAAGLEQPSETADAAPPPEKLPPGKAPPPKREEDPEDFDISIDETVFEVPAS